MLSILGEGCSERRRYERGSCDGYGEMEDLCLVTTLTTSFN